MDTLKHRIAEEVETFYKTVDEVKAELLVKKVANRIPMIGVKTLTQNTLPEVKTEALDDKLAKRPSRFRHFLPHCLAERLTDLEIETLGETEAEKYPEVLLKNWLKR